MSRPRFAVIPFVMLLLAACGTLPGVNTEVSYCCGPSAERVHTYRVEFEDMPEFLKPMLRDEASIVLAAKGFEYTEQEADAVLLMQFINTPLTNQEAEQYAAWGTIEPGGEAHFIAEVRMRMTESVTGEQLLSGSMRRVHSIFEGSYMHEAPARAAMRLAFQRLFAELAPGTISD